MDTDTSNKDTFLNPFGCEETDELLEESKSNLKLYWNGYIKKFNSWTDDNKMFKSAKTYKNKYIAYALWIIGTVMLIYAFWELPFISLYPQSFLRNMSIGSSWVYFGFAIYNKLRLINLLFNY